MNIIRNTLLLLSMTAIFSTTIGMDQNQPPQNPQGQPADQAQAKKTSQEEVDAARTRYYDQKSADSQATQKLNEHAHTWRGISEEEATKQTVNLAFGWLNAGISRGFDEGRKYFFGPSEEEKMIQEGQKLDRELKEEQIKGQKISNEASATTQESKAKEHTLLDKQELNYDIDAADKIAARAPGAFNNPQVQKRWRELAAKAGIEIPEEPAKDTSAKDDPQKTDLQEKKKSLLSKLTTPFVFALTTTGDVADFLAGYSVAHITNLDCFKDTFVQTSTFNRVVVIATIAGATYGGYQFYKSRYSDDNDDDALELD